MLTRAASKGEEHGQEPKAGIVHGMILARYESGSPNDPDALTQSLFSLKSELVIVYKPLCGLPE